MSNENEERSRGGNEEIIRINWVSFRCKCGQFQWTYAFIRKTDSTQLLFTRIWYRKTKGKQNFPRKKAKEKQNHDIVKCTTLRHLSYVIYIIDVQTGRIWLKYVFFLLITSLTGNDWTHSRRKETQNIVLSAIHVMKTYHNLC